MLREPAVGAPQQANKGPRRSARLAAIGLLGAVVLAALVWLLDDLRRHQASLGWPSTAGRIVSAQVNRRWEEDEGFACSFSASYEDIVGGQQHASNRLSFGLPPDLSCSTADDWLTDYPAGASVPVYYDPADPSTSVLWPGYGTKASLVQLAIPLGALTLGGALLMAFTLARKRRRM